MKSTQEIAVVTCDLVKSRAYVAPDRQKVQRELLKAWGVVERCYAKGLDTRFAFRVTAGDEFQFVAKDFGSALLALTHLRVLARQIQVKPLVTIRAAIGIGSRSVRSAKSPYEQDGPAFRAAREQIERLKRKRHLTGVASCEVRAGLELVNEFLPALDRIYAEWTAAQAKVMQFSMNELPSEQIAKRLRVSPANVSKHLTRSKAIEYLQGIRATIRITELG